jgi:mRNA interferase RelE/StbE
MKAFRWRPAARADLRTIDQETAMRILHAITRYGDTGEGDVKMLPDGGGLYRLRVGKWRVFFDLDEPGTVRSPHRQPRSGLLKAS